MKRFLIHLALYFSIAIVISTIDYQVFDRLLGIAHSHFLLSIIAWTFISRKTDKFVGEKFFNEGEITFHGTRGSVKALGEIINGAMEEARKEILEKRSKKKSAKI
jgi:hypothetical protein